MMRVIGVLCAIALAIACFFPWVTIESKDIIVSGVEASGTSFGKPGYLHFLLAGIHFIFLLINRLWSSRTNLLINALNIAWAFRNFLLIPMCHGGECPVKHIALYIVLAASFGMLLSALLTNASTPKNVTNSTTIDQDHLL